MNIKGLLKFLIAIVASIAFVLVISFVTNAIYTPIKDNGPGYTLPVPEVAVAAEEQPKITEQENNQPVAQTQEPTTEQPVAETQAPVAEPSLASLLSTADVDAGKKVSRKCSACHSLKEGGKTLVGPALWDIVGKNIGAIEGYKYSSVFQELNASGKTWTYENLNEFLTSVKAFAPKTKMSFAGLKKAEDRANLLAYFQTLSNEPVAFPSE